MIRMVLEDAQNFKKSVDAISVLIDEAEFIVSEEGFSLKSTDPSQISMVDFELPKSAFKEYNVSVTTKIGLDLDYLSQIMSRSKSKDELVLEMKDNDSRLNVEFRGHSIRKFSIPLIDISSLTIPNPKIEFDAELNLKGEVIQDALKDALLVSTHITLGVDSEKFFVKASSSKGELNTTVKKGESSVNEFKVISECEAMFPLDYLLDMLKAASFADGIEIKLKTNAPVRLSYKIGNSKIVYFLAPRIETQ